MQKETLLTHQIDLLFWMNSCSYLCSWKSSLYQLLFLPETNSMLSSGFVCCWASPWARGSRGYFKYKRRVPRGGGIALEIMSTLERLNIVLVFIRITSSQNVCFRSRHFELSIDITHMSVCWVFAELQFILVTDFKEQFAETEKRESASCLFSFFFKTTKFCCYCECTQKNRHFKVSIDV